MKLKCPQCGNFFEKRTFWQIYCSRSCRENSERAWPNIYLDPEKWGLSIVAKTKTEWDDYSLFVVWRHEDGRVFCPLKGFNSFGGEVTFDKLTQVRSYTHLESLAKAWVKGREWRYRDHRKNQVHELLEKCEALFEAEVQARKKAESWKTSFFTLLFFIVYLYLATLFGCPTGGED